MMLTSSCRRLLLLVLLPFIIVYIYCSNSAFISFIPFASRQSLSCGPLSNASDILIVLKTGASVTSRLDAHIQTTLKCYPHYVIYSDLDEEYRGLQLLDVLAGVTDSTRARIADFTFCWQQRAHRAQGLDPPTTLSSHDTQDEPEASLGWNLDKWKFLPMLRAALLARPQAKWFVFIEADTYLVLRNLLLLLRRFDERQALYIGTPAWIGDETFARGGSGFILSRAALESIDAELGKDAQKRIWEERVADACCGDLVMAQVLQSVGIELTTRWPLIQGEPYTTLDWTERHWCTPAVTFHHVDGKGVEVLWELEQAWSKGEERGPLLYRDVFEWFVEPELRGEKVAWDNLSGDWFLRSKAALFPAPNREEEDEGYDLYVMENEVASASFEACREKCESKVECLQFSWRTGECRLGDVVRLGAAVSADMGDMRSGWMIQRIATWKRRLTGCSINWEDREWTKDE